MTITAVANSAGSPPSVDVTVAVPVGSVMQEVSLWRNDSNGRSLVRTQPSPGFDSRTVTDYECPYGELVTYDWAAEYFDPNDLVTLWSESWADTSSWTVSAGSFNVSGGKVRNNAAGSGSIYRDVIPGSHRVTIASMSASSGSRATVRIDLNIGAFGLFVEGGILYVAGAATAIDPAQPISFDMSPTDLTVTGTGGSVSYEGGATTLTRVYVNYSSAGAANQAQVGGVVVASYPTSPSTVAETSDPVQLDPANAWLVHPATPTASFPLTYDNGDEAGIVAIGPVENGSASTLHRILGARTPIATTTGPRYADQTTMTVALNTPEERAGMRGLLASDTPILIQIPPAWGLEFNCGFYHVGDTTTARLETAEDRRRITLPLTRVQAPVVDVDGGDWTYAGVAVEFDAYYELATTFDTYADLAANVRA